MGRFVRPAPSRRLGRKVFVAAEGSVTEEEYLEILCDMGCDDLYFIHSRSGKSAPRQVLSRMEKKLQGVSLQPEDEAWLLVDRDDWKSSDIEALFTWKKKAPCHHVVVSNPCVEFWLLLHFEDGVGAVNAQICQQRLKRFLPGYSSKNKHLPPGSLTRDKILLAMARAKRLCEQKSWTEPCTTTFHHLVQSLLKVRD